MVHVAKIKTHHVHQTIFVVNDALRSHISEAPEEIDQVVIAINERPIDALTAGQIEYGGAQSERQRTLPAARFDHHARANCSGPREVLADTRDSHELVVITEAAVTAEIDPHASYDFRPLPRDDVMPGAIKVVPY